MFSQQHQSDRARPSNDNRRFLAGQDGKVARSGILAVAQVAGSVVLTYVAEGTFILSRHLAS